MMTRGINLFKDDVNASFEPFLRINVELVDLLHQPLQFLQRHLVEDATQLAIQLLQHNTSTFQCSI